MQMITDPGQLTADQRDLIVAASHNRGRLNIAVRADTHGRAVRGKDQAFFDPDDREVAKRFIRVVSDLKNLQLMRQQGSRDGYELTNFGWLISRKLKSH